MIRHIDRQRSGITLVEILISILIMGVGLISLATLFPLGLLRLRDAQRSSRSSYLTDSAGADLEGRNLFNKLTFRNPYYSPWNNLPVFTSIPYDPWIQDTGTHALGSVANPTTGVSRDPSVTGTFGPGLPVAYDPLWRYQADPTPINTTTTLPTGIYLGDSRTEARFGSGVGFVRSDPDGSAASAYGLQRLTNFFIGVTYPYTPAPFGQYLFSQTTVPDIFVSPEDIVLQSEVGAQAASNASPIVPDMSFGTPMSDWRFSWMFTGQQTDALNGTVFNGDVVIFENRPFGINQQNGQWVVDGETVVEAVFGYGNNVNPVFASAGFARAADRTILLRWPISVPDPDVKVGGWIADVTYERNLSVQNSRFILPDYPYQRCHWYQIVKRTQPSTAVAFSGDPTTYRSMTVWINTPLKAQTLVSTSNGQPVHINVALIAPHVVNVFPKVIYAR